MTRPGWAPLSLILPVVLGAIVILDAAGCAALRYELQSEFAAWRKNLAAQGWTVTAGAATPGGFPWGADLSIRDLGIAGGQAMLPGGLDWHADRVVLSISLRRFWGFTIAPEGQQIVRAAGAPAIVLSADHLAVFVPLGRGPERTITMEAESLTAGLVRSRQPADVRIGHLLLQAGARTKSSARIDAWADVSATAVDLPDTIRWPLGGQVQAVSAALSLASPALSGAHAAEQARAWRDWGGQMTVNSLDLRWGPLSVQAQAHLNLDDALQPQGQGSAVVGGWSQTVDALAASGAVPAGVAETAKFVMGLMPHTRSAEGDALSLPLVLKDSTLSIGKIPVVHLHGIRWDAV